MKRGVVSKVRPEEEGKVCMISNLVLVPKKDQEFWAAFDGTSLNEHTVDVPQVIPDVESVWRQLQLDHLVFITADLKDGFHHVKVEEEGTWLLVFYGPTSTELYHFLVAPFGCKEIPAVFRRWVEHIMEDYPAVLHYFDDLHSIVGPSAEVQKRYDEAKRLLESVNLQKIEREAIISSWDQILEVRLPEMMRATRDRLAIPNFDKVWIGGAVPCLGTTRTRNGLLPHQETMELLEKLDEMRQALELVRYITPSVPMLAAPLALWNSLTSTKKEFQWTPEAAGLVSDLKQCLKEAVVRAPPDPKLLLLSYCDASTMGCGRIIFQLAEDGQLRILCCWSTVHGPAMASRPPMELELNGLYLLGEDGGICQHAGGTRVQCVHGSPPSSQGAGASRRDKTAHDAAHRH
jgi:hypothetical protein